MNLRKKIVEQLKTDKVEESWNNRKLILKRVVFEMSNGEMRELHGEAANEWHKDLHYRNCGEVVDWKRHKFQITKKNHEPLFVVF